MSNAKKGTPYALCLLIVIAVSLGLGCAKKAGSGQVAIKINNYTLTAAEFNTLAKELEIEDTPQARKAFVDNLVVQKLILQEAQKEGLDKQKDFLKAVENFWQQSLLKVMVDKKIKETSGEISVTEKEIEDYYKKWKEANPDNKKTLAELHDTIRVQVMRQKQAVVMNTWIEGLLKKSNIKIDRKAVGLE